MAYKYGYEDLDLFIEQGTDRVPNDGQFHFVLRGQVIEHEASEKRALGRLQQLRNSLPTDEEISAGANLQSKRRAGEIAARHLQQSTSEKTSEYGRKGRKG